MCLNKKKKKVFPNLFLTEFVCHTVFLGSVEWSLLPFTCKQSFIIQCKLVVVLELLEVMGMLGSLWQLLRLCVWSPAGGTIELTCDMAGVKLELISEDLN